MKGVSCEHWRSPVVRGCHCAPRAAGSDEAELAVRRRTTAQFAVMNEQEDAPVFIRPAVMNSGRV